MTGMTDRMWVNSGDADVLEPPGLWEERMPADLAARMPHSERIDERTERVHIDGRSFERKIGINPVLSDEDMERAGANTSWRKAGMRFSEVQNRPPGAHDVQLRLQDLDDEGIWGEIVYPSIGLWNGMIKDPVLYREGVRVLNDYLKETYLDFTPRSVPAAEISVRSVEDAVAEAIRAAEMGFKALNLPTTLDQEGMQNWNYDVWEPLWATAEEAGLVLAIHIGSEAKDPAGSRNRVFHGPGGAVAQLRGDHLRRPAGSHHAGHFRSPGPPPRPEGADLRGRRNLGALHRRPHGRGLPPAWGVCAAQAIPPTQRDHLRASLRLLPARQVSRPGLHRHGLPQRHVGQRLPPPGGHLRAHPESPARTVRRRGRGRPLPYDPGRLPGTLPRRRPTSRRLASAAVGL